MGQDKPVRIIHLITDSKEEKTVSDALKSKAKNQFEFLQYIQKNTDLTFNN